KVAKVAIKQMSAGYPELLPRSETLLRFVDEEERTFSKTLELESPAFSGQLCATVWNYIQKNPNSELASLFPLAKSALEKGEFKIVRESDGLLHTIDVNLKPY